MCGDIGLEVSRLVAGEVIVALEIRDPYRWREFAVELKSVERCLKNELSLHQFLVIPRAKCHYYKDIQHFGDDVANKFPAINDDVERAGKCFATGNYTATVFHLMRVMERGVQYLGAKLGIQLAEEKEWQPILNEINGVIKRLSNPPTTMTPQMKAERDSFAAASERLQNVKDAWRNKVMHPKDSYTESEAEEVFNATKKFMQHLATIL